MVREGAERPAEVSQVCEGLPPIQREAAISPPTGSYRQGQGKFRCSHSMATSDSPYSSLQRLGCCIDSWTSSFPGGVHLSFLWRESWPEPTVPPAHGKREDKIKRLVSKWWTSASAILSSYACPTLRMFHRRGAMAIGSLGRYNS